MKSAVTIYMPDSFAFKRFLDKHFPEIEVQVQRNAMTETFTITASDEDASAMLDLWDESRFTN